MADITPGYTFASGEKNIDHTKLNTATAGTINTTFHTGKASAGSNPNTGDSEVMLYDSAGAVYKRGTLAAVVFDHTALLSARTGKTAPVKADALLLSDSAASGAYKQITHSNLLFGAAAHSAPVGADTLPIYNSAGALSGSITLENLITLLAANTNPLPTAAELMIRESAGVVRKVTLQNLINQAAALAVPAAGHKLAIYDGAYKSITLAELISGIATALATPAGAELLQVNDAGVLKKLSLANLRTYTTAGIVKGYVQVREEQSTGVDGGVFTLGAWRTRSLNAEVVDTASLASLAGNQVTLAAGTYRFCGWGMARDAGQHKVRLQNVTDATVVQEGLCARSANNNSNSSVVSGRFTIATSKAFELQHWCTVTGTFGTAVGDGSDECYAQVEFWKEEE